MGDVGIETLGGDNGENREKAKGPECADAPLCAAVISKGGVVKPSEV
jgi:hypothetical protein